MSFSYGGDYSNKEVVDDGSTEAWGGERPVSLPSTVSLTNQPLEGGGETKKKLGGLNRWLPFTKSVNSSETSTPEPSSPATVPSTQSLSSRFKASLTPSPSKPHLAIKVSTNTTTKYSEYKSTTVITEVGIEPLVYLLQFVSVQSLLNLKRVNRRFKYLVGLDRVWAQRLKLIKYGLEWEEELPVGDRGAKTPEHILKNIWNEFKRPYLQFLDITSADVYLSVFNCGSFFASTEALETTTEGDPASITHHPLTVIAKKLFRLVNLSKAHMVDNWSQIDLNLTVMQCYYESALLTNLNLAYAEMDLEDLRVQCTALQHLKGGNTGIRWLIEQNPIFTFQDYSAPDDVSDLDAVLDMLEQYFEGFYREIELEDVLLTKLFKDATEGNTVFIEQMLRDCLPQLLHPILNNAEEQSDMLPSLYPEILVKCLDLGVDMINLLKQSTILIDLNRVETSFYYFFRPILDLYVKNELLFLDLNYSTLTKSFLYKTFGSLETADQVQASGFLGNIDQHRKKMIDSVSKAFAQPTNMFNFSLTAINKRASRDNPSAVDDYEGSVLDDVSNSKPRSAPVTGKENVNPFDFSGYISMELARTMIELNTQALHRVTKFQYFSQFHACDRLVKNTIENVFTRLTSYLGNHHISKAFGVTFRQLRTHQSAQFQTLSGELVGPVLSFFELTKLADGVQACLDVYYHKDLTKFIDPNDFLDTCNIAKKRFEINIDEVVAEGLDLSIQTLMHHVHFLLQHYQQPIDFKPGRPLDNLKPTQACQEVVNCLIAHVSLVRRSDLEPRLVEVFYSEIALRLFNDLCKHIKAYLFDEAGGYQLMSDLSGYFSWVITLNISDVIPHFQALKEVANLFLLTPDNLKILLHDQERFMGIFHPEDLLEFVQRRVDYKKIQKHVEVEGCSLM